MKGCNLIPYTCMVLILNFLKNVEFLKIFRQGRSRNLQYNDTEELIFGPLLYFRMLIHIFLGTSSFFFSFSFYRKMAFMPKLNKILKICLILLKGNGTSYILWNFYKDIFIIRFLMMKWIFLCTQDRPIFRNYCA